MVQRQLQDIQTSSYTQKTIYDCLNIEDEDLEIISQANSSSNTLSELPDRVGAANVVKGSLQQTQNKSQGFNYVQAITQNCNMETQQPLAFLPKYLLTCQSLRDGSKNNMIGDVSPEEVRYADYLVKRQGEQQDDNEVQNILNVKFEFESEEKKYNLQVIYESLKKDQKQQYLQQLQSELGQQAASQQSWTFPNGSQSRQQFQEDLSFSRGPIQSFTEYQKFLYPSNELEEYQCIIHWEAVIGSLGQIEKDIDDNQSDEWWLKSDALDPNNTQSDKATAIPGFSQSGWQSHDQPGTYSYRSEFEENFPNAPNKANIQLDGQFERVQVYLPIYEKKSESIEKQLLKEHSRLLQKYNQADICFLIDATNSMQDYIDGIKSQINQTVDMVSREVCRLLPDQIQVAYVCYRDFGDERIIEKLDFTKSVLEFQKSLGSIIAYGGQDVPEDVISGIQEVQNLNWKKHSFKVLCHIADAPCHGSMFHNQSLFRDRYKNGDYKNRDIIKELVGLYEKHDIENYQFFHVQKQFTGKMIAEFRARCSKFGVPYSWFQEINNISANAMGFIIARSTLQSYSQSLGNVSRTASISVLSSRSQQSKTKNNLLEDLPLARRSQSSRASNKSDSVQSSNGYSVESSAFCGSRSSSTRSKNVKIIQNESQSNKDFRSKVYKPDFMFQSVDWNIVQPSSGTELFNANPVNIFVLLDLIRTRQPLDQHYFTNKKKSCKTLRIHKQVFSKSGGCRYPYYALQQSLHKGNVSHVLKQFKNPELQQLPYYLQQMEISTIADFMQKQFKKECTLLGVQFSNFRFIRSKVFLNKTYNLEDNQWFDARNIYNLEQLLPGKCIIEKFNTNFGHVNPKANPEYNEFLQTFSHWTYCISHKVFVIVDLQGTWDDKCRQMVLTDPAIHCPADPLRFARTNLGQAGILEFLKSHKCNQYCKNLEIFDEKLKGRNYLDSIQEDDQGVDSTEIGSIVPKLHDLKLFNDMK